MINVDSTSSGLNLHYEICLSNKFTVYEIDHKLNPVPTKFIHAIIFFESYL